jgi:hypothetical protein
MEQWRFFRWNIHVINWHNQCYPLGQWKQLHLKYRRHVWYIVWWYPFRNWRNCVRSGCQR